MAKTPMPWQAIEVFSSTSKWNFEMTDAILSPQEAKWTAEAQAVGLTWLKRTRLGLSLFGFNACKHEQEIRNDAVRRNSFRCATCCEDKRRAIAETLDMTWLKHLRAQYSLFRFNSCGHEQEVQHHMLHIHRPKCRTCLENRLDIEAVGAGLTRLKKVSRGRSLFRFNVCGHKQEIQDTSVRYGHSTCHECKHTWATLKSNLYVSFIEVQGEHIVKVGIARVVARRIGDYGLPTCAQVATPLVIPFETGLIAKQAEQKVLRAFKHAKHPAAEHFFTKSGQTECFRPEFLSAILEYCKAL